MHVPPDEPETAKTETALYKITVLLWEANWMFRKISNSLPAMPDIVRCGGTALM
jgi:hypothetical protein